MLVLRYLRVNHLTCIDIHIIINSMHNSGYLGLPGRTSKMGNDYADKETVIKHRFPYDLVKYIAGLLLAWLLSVALSLLGTFFDGSLITPKRISSMFGVAFVCVVPILVWCSLVRRYWMPLSIMICIVMAYSLFVVLAWMPKPAGISVLQHVWNSMSSFLGTVVVYVIPAAFFQQYCEWVCRAQSEDQTSGG